MLELKKGEKVILKGFTGIKLGVFEVTAVTKKTITICKKNGDEMVFDKKTGKQINVEEGKERYANSIMEDDGSYVAPSTKSASKKKAVKKSASKRATVEEPEEDEEEEEAPAPKKSAKKPAKAAKKSKKPVEVEDEEDEEEDEDEFEEID